MRIDPNPHTALDPADLSARWLRARGGALGKVLPHGETESEEARALAAVEPGARAAVAEALFRNSWRLGRSAAARSGSVRGVEAMAGLLTLFECPPCLAGTWATAAGTATHRRGGCAANPTGERFLCDAWREAIDGLICGLSEDVLFVRRSSRGRGGEFCEDLLYATEGRALAWSPPTPELARTLDRVADGLSERGVAVRFLGVAENRVAYMVEVAALPSCGPAGGVVHALIENHLHHLLPGFELADSSPRAVL